MARFINKKTGNIVNVKDQSTIELMKKSERYETVKDKKNSKSDSAE